MIIWMNIESSTNNLNFIIEWKLLIVLLNCFDNIKIEARELKKKRFGLCKYIILDH